MGKPRGSSDPVNEILLLKAREILEKLGIEPNLSERSISDCIDQLVKLIHGTVPSATKHGVAFIVRDTFELAGEYRKATPGYAHVIQNTQKRLKNSLGQIWYYEAVRRSSYALTLCGNDIDQALEHQAELGAVKAMKDTIGKEFGLFRFVGELFNVGFLQEPLILNIVEALLDNISDQKVNYLHILLATAGFKIFACIKTLGNSAEEGRSQELPVITVESVRQKLQFFVVVPTYKFSLRARMLLSDLLQIWENEGLYHSSPRSCASTSTLMANGVNDVETKLNPMAKHPTDQLTCLSMIESSGKSGKPGTSENEVLSSNEEVVIKSVEVKSQKPKAETDPKCFASGMEESAGETIFSSATALVKSTSCNNSLDPCIDSAKEILNKISNTNFNSRILDFLNLCNTPARVETLAKLLQERATALPAKAIVYSRVVQRTLTNNIRGVFRDITVQLCIDQLEKLYGFDDILHAGIPTMSEKNFEDVVYSFSKKRRQCLSCAKFLGELVNDNLVKQTSVVGLCTVLSANDDIASYDILYVFLLTAGKEMDSYFASTQRNKIASVFEKLRLICGNNSLAPVRLRTAIASLLYIRKNYWEGLENHLQELTNYIYDDVMNTLGKVRQKLSHPETSSVSEAAEEPHRESQSEANLTTQPQLQKDDPADLSKPIGLNIDAVEQMGKQAPPIHAFTQAKEGILEELAEQVEAKEIILSDSFEPDQKAKTVLDETLAEVETLLNSSRTGIAALTETLKQTDVLSELPNTKIITTVVENCLERNDKKENDLRDLLEPPTPSEIVFYAELAESEAELSDESRESTVSNSVNSEVIEPALTVAVVRFYLDAQELTSLVKMFFETTIVNLRLLHENIKVLQEGMSDQNSDTYAQFREIIYTYSLHQVEIDTLSNVKTAFINATGELVCFRVPRHLVVMRVLGELFNEGILGLSHMVDCVLSRLLENDLSNHKMFKCLLILLKTIGPSLDNQLKDVEMQLGGTDVMEGPNSECYLNCSYFDDLLESLENRIEQLQQKRIKVPKIIRVSFKDLLDCRNSHWNPKFAQESHKTLYGKYMLTKPGSLNHPELLPKTSSKRIQYSRDELCKILHDSSHLILTLPTSLSQLLPALQASPIPCSIKILETVEMDTRKVLALLSPRQNFAQLCDRLSEIMCATAVRYPVAQEAVFSFIFEHALSVPGDTGVYARVVKELLEKEKFSTRKKKINPFMNSVDSRKLIVTERQAHLTKDLTLLFAKLTDDTFDHILSEFQHFIGKQANELDLDAIIGFIFDETCLQPHRSSLFARLIKCLCIISGTGYSLEKASKFKSGVIEQCQLQLMKINSQQREIVCDNGATSSVNLLKPLSESYSCRSDRLIGCVQIMAHLFLEEVLTPHFILNYIQVLLGGYDKNNHKYLCKILEIAGRKLQEFSEEISRLNCDALKHYGSPNSFQHLNMYTNFANISPGKLSEFVPLLLSSARNVTQFFAHYWDLPNGGNSLDLGDIFTGVTVAPDSDYASSAPLTGALPKKDFDANPSENNACESEAVSSDSGMFSPEKIKFVPELNIRCNAPKPEEHSFSARKTVGRACKRHTEQSEQSSRAVVKAMVFPVPHSPQVGEEKASKAPSKDIVEPWAFTDESTYAIVSSYQHSLENTGSLETISDVEIALDVASLSDRSRMSDPELIGDDNGARKRKPKRKSAGLCKTQ